VFRRSTIEGPSYLFKHALVQDTAYESLLVSKRQQLHARLAQALEATEGADPLELARHYAIAKQAEKAAALYLASGQQLLATSALHEASGSLELGLKEVETLDPSAKRDRLDLDLRVALGAARMASLGWAHSSVGEALEPAFALARKFNDREALGPILWGLWVHTQTRTEFSRAYGWLKELDRAVAEAESPELSVVRDMTAGCQYFWVADYDRAAGFTDHIRANYDAAQHGRIVAYTNHDPLVFSLHWAGSFVDWIVGYPDRSLERIDQALALAHRLNHPFNLAFALTTGAHSMLLSGRIERMLTQCDEAETIIAEEGLGPFAHNVLVRQSRGQALTLAGEHASGYELMKQGNDFWNLSEGRICNAMFWSWMVLGLGGLGRRREAIELIDRAIRHCRETGDCFMEPECLRIKGGLLLAGERPNGDGAAVILEEAVRLARDHGAKSWELRAATDLARLWRERDRNGEARGLLTPVYEWFREGFDTPDLKRAKALLEEL
jgi:predicted ATPase